MYDRQKRRLRVNRTVAPTAHERNSLKAYVGAEAEARAAKRGVWQGEFEMPWD